MARPCRLYICTGKAGSPTLCFMTSPAKSLQSLLHGSSHLWRGGEVARIDARSTGYANLDARLPGGGWPVGALIEIAPETDGLGELRLTLPALEAWCQEGRSVAFVRPPHIPYAPALSRYGLTLGSLLWVAADSDEDGRWAAEQLLREGAAAVLLWSEAREDRALRRLQLAAETGKACAFLYRPPLALTHASPAALRIAVCAADDGVSLDIVKVRGGHPGRLVLPLTRPAA
jgi:protein ImuA